MRYPIHLEQRLANLVSERLRVAWRLIRDLLRDGTPPREAVALVRAALLRIPWEHERIAHLGREAERYTARELVSCVGEQARRPEVQATLLDVTTYSTRDTREPVVRRDAAGPVTIQGTRFLARHKVSEVVLVDVDKLEESYRQTPAGYQPRGQHDKRALHYGDILDANAPAGMLRMADVEDWRQGHKIAALRDRGYKVVPVEVPASERKKVEDTYGTTTTKQAAIARGVGAEVIDAEAWTLGIIGRGANIERAAFADIEEVVDHGHRRGWDTKAIGAQIQKKLGIAERRARFVARTELARTNADLTRAKQERLGFQFYRWTTAHDERVRPEHKALDGSIRAWSKPHPTEGHPGESFNCRCVAVPVTVDEYNEQQRKARRPLAVAVGVGLGAGVGVGVGLLASRGLRVPRVEPVRPIRPVQPVRPVAPVRPAQPAQQPGTPLEVEPLRPANEPFPAYPGQMIPFRVAPGTRRRVENRSLFNFAHSLVESVRRAERTAGETLSHYGATFQAAIKAIRESKTNAELRERLSRLAGRGRVVGIPKKPMLLPGPTIAQPKKGSGS